MKLTLNDPNTGGDLLLIHDEGNFNMQSYTRDKEKKYFTIAWNKGGQQTIDIDGVEHNFMSRSIVPLMFNQTFTFENPADIVAWQFNREFYCIVDHDAEVSCVGFLFGAGDQIFIPLEEQALNKLQLMHQLFVAEMNTRDQIQRDMLIMLLKRLIIDITRLARSTYLPDPKQHDDRLDIFRHFNLLVEGHFKKEHSVQFYANKLNKSAKTLANLFPSYSSKTPLQIIQSRIILEARRLLSYTDKTVKQVTYELGFEDPAYFCTFFKRYTGMAPVEFRKTRELAVSGK